ncbi:UDP-N-acetylmuramoyl-tripeptide--D-alanyl-D-alanine ligase [candidate division KSB1 bacterium]|nr:UDP-N-acetylmuramoyl-tripeptide--D-alanyl-D-alanine ligase [candidate division KSB1 bacterium]RQW04364.1 MAG: UDP-N-acetylmuramoyl-tripeptide--D-alanyl-D-alanine ligase [candidate division KSB1 bacterium]
MKLTLQEIIAHLDCRTTGVASTGELTGVSTDSRSVKAGELFVALRGENFDGHDFVRQALSDGAVAALVDHNYPDVDVSAEKCVLHVPDTLKSYQDIARFYRAKLAPAVVALTGSAGKTTCKEYVHAVLALKYNVHKNIKSFNNHVGVPATLLALKPEHDILVAELGTSNFGEISHLSSLVEPNICLVLNIGYAHLEFLHSLDGVARAKMEIFDFAADDNIAIYNADDAILKRQHFPSNTVKTFGIQYPADVHAKNLRCEQNGCYHFDIDGTTFQLNIPGRHNIYNALAAITVGTVFDIPLDRMKNAIEAVTSAEHRMTVLRTKNNILIDDAYNSNPGSCAAALATLADVAPGEGGRRIAVLGDMLELGQFSQLEHEKLAVVAQNNQIDALYLLGEHTQHTAAKAKQLNIKFIHYTKDRHSLMADLTAFIAKNDVILIKGSRAMHMEDMVNALKDESI